LELDREGGPAYNDQQFSEKQGEKIEKDIPAKKEQTAGHLWVPGEDEHPCGPQTYQPKEGKGSEEAGLELKEAES